MRWKRCIRMTMVLAAAALAACGEKTAAPDATPKAASAGPQPTRSGPAVDTAEASAETAWIELMGGWAPKEACADYRQKWIIEANAFHLHELHCAVGSIELAGNGVKAAAECSIEGYNDGVVDIYIFERRKDATLTILQHAGDAKTESLVPCPEDVIP